MAFTSDIIKKAVALGFTPDVRNGGNSVRMYICPQCKKTARMKFRKAGEVREACKCGFRKKG